MLSTIVGINLNLASVAYAPHFAPDRPRLGDRQGPREGYSMSTPLKEALVALTDALAKRPAEEILFQWFRSGRLIGELSGLMKRRHPSVQAEIDRVHQEHQAKRRKKTDAMMGPAKASN
jgi:hypothetical protein